MPPPPAKGEVWIAQLDPVRGHEQGGQRPVLVLSTDRFNRGPSGLVVVAPFTRTERRVPLHLRVEPPEGGLKDVSYLMCEDIRSISVERLVSRWGEVSPETMLEAAARLRYLLVL